ncbi:MULTISPECIES: phosphoribosylformylglycinamidine cyclo-ligase [Clostridia]|jgi:phosphoribosylformylglycinamidine cyclo-ligase|uniref:phosphoribosylformylglycinamidine cyclo-ligase n=2 Tax=Bacillota TaxID=1239 RepID=UPI000E4B1F0A|nr:MULTISPECIES: phosphoribosylformylglycinamidine cyclo-ligase [unclassified Clostridium]RGG79567.1 phosphoribosylformylglycinamidine cyclo-ligase [Clostridium sp. AF17-21AC]RHR59977.1 phosphoribosylformylglycinamidine cyclo-ligase [Clostridium sp. AF17-2]
MLDSIKVGNFIMGKRKSLGMTQQQLADKLNVSFQAISKWENGTTYPNIEILRDLAIVLDVSVDEILAGSERGAEGLSYSKAGIDITYTDTIKREMAKHLDTKDDRVLNGLGPFASLYDIKFQEIENPVLVLKSEEPGSKQKLAIEYGYSESICHDMVNHLVNDIVVMGAKPLAVLDTIVCGNAEADTIKTLVKGVSDACKENECSLVGGETSIQPLVVDPGVYVLTSSIAGIVERSKVIDGSQIKEGDAVLAIASNGLHTNGYSLVRLLMDKMPQIKLDKIDGLTFIEQIMKPHTPYYRSIKDLFDKDVIHGMAHITGGGIEGNLCRIIPEGLSAKIDLSKIKILDIFKYIRNNGNISDEEMLRTFNCGVGFNIVTNQKDKAAVMHHVSRFYDCYEIGVIESGDRKVKFENRLNWL